METPEQSGVFFAFIIIRNNMGERRLAYACAGTGLFMPSAPIA
jgi:hypothetical protein